MSRKVKLTKQHLNRLHPGDLMLLLFLRDQGLKSKLQLLQMLGPDIFKRLSDLSVFEEGADPLGSNIPMFKVKDELCESD